MQQLSQQLGTERINWLLIKQSTPAMVGLLVSALYSLVDAIFIGKGVGTLGLAGVSVAFPVQMVLMAVAGALGIGGASVVSRRLGAARIEEANHVLGNIVSLVLLISAFSALGGLVLVEPVLYLFGATPSILPYAKEYLSTILIGSVFFAFAMACNAIIRAEGNAKTGMLTLIFSAVMNILLDPLFILGLNMGIKGAALATVVSQALAAFYMLYYFVNGKSSLSLSWAGLIPGWAVIKETLAVGLAAFTWQVGGSVMYLVVNNLLAAYGGDLYLAIFGIANRIVMIAIMPVMGVVQGMQPIIGYNYGAGQMGRVNYTLALAFKYATIMSVAAYSIMMLLPGFLLRIFTADLALITNGIPVIRIIYAAAFLIGAQMVASGFYQALGKGKQALVLSMVRPILILIPLLLLLPLFWQLTGVWLAFPLADVIAFVITGAIFVRDKKRGELEPSSQSGTETKAAA